MKKQSFFFRPRDLLPHNTVSLSTMGFDVPEGSCRVEGRDWQREQACRGRYYVVNAFEGYSTAETVGYTRQEDYVKINFWLSGKHTTVVDGYGQHDHERPEVFITTGPLEMVKVDLCNRQAQVASLAVCVQREFFPQRMGLALDELPEPLRSIVTQDEMPYAFHRYPLRPDLLAASRAVLAAPFKVRREPLYSQAKAIELMCLLLNFMGNEGRSPATIELRGRQEARLRYAFEFITRHYAEPVSLARISREVGLNKMALTSGFRQRYGMSVYDCLQKVRMERAYELLQDEENPIARVAQAVGYGHSCNFSTAFHAYFGCTPQSVRQQLA